MASQAIDTFKATYTDLSDTVNNLNKEISFYNIKTVAKIYVFFLAFVSIGALAGWCISSLGLPAQLAFMPLLLIGSFYLLGKCDALFFKDTERGFKKRIIEIFK